VRRDRDRKGNVQRRTLHACCGDEVWHRRCVNHGPTGFDPVAWTPHNRVKATATPKNGKQTVGRLTISLRAAAHAPAYCDLATFARGSQLRDLATVRALGHPDQFECLIT